MPEKRLRQWLILGSHTLDFLFSRNRLNVAVWRAMCVACIVASPRLLERARAIEQMRLINALSRFAEMPGEQVIQP